MFIRLSQILFFCFMLQSGPAQITVQNPSFEDEPSDATVPQGWHACQPLTTPDILPGYWGVYDEPNEGETYVGIITRENGTFESFGQRLSAPVGKNECHNFTIDLAHSFIYAGYSNPIKLRIYLGNTKCDREQLIFESPLITHAEWKTYEVEFRPKEAYQYIIIEAFIKEGNFSHKGNILIDHLSSIVFCSRV